MRGGREIGSGRPASCIEKVHHRLIGAQTVCDAAEVGKIRGNSALGSALLAAKAHSHSHKSTKELGPILSAQRTHSARAPLGAFQLPILHCQASPKVLPRHSICSPRSPTASRSPVPVGAQWRRKKGHFLWRWLGAQLELECAHLLLVHTHTHTLAPNCLGRISRKCVSLLIVVVVVVVVCFSHHSLHNGAAPMEQRPNSSKHVQEKKTSAHLEARKQASSQAGQLAHLPAQWLCARAPPKGGQIGAARSSRGVRACAPLHWRPALFRPALSAGA